MINCRAIDRLQNNSGVTIGYVLQDDTGNISQMQSKEIKQYIKQNKLKVYNLEITDDNKLIHVASRDKIGISVPFEQFWSGRVGDWNIGPISDAQFGAKNVIITHIKTGRQLQLEVGKYKRIYEYNVTYTPDKSLFSGILPSGHSISINIQSENCIEDLEKAFNTFLQDANYWDNYAKTRKDNKENKSLSSSSFPEYGSWEYFNHVLDPEEQQKEIHDPNSPYYKGGTVKTGSGRDYLKEMASNGIYEYGSKEYWDSLDAEERQKEIHDPSSPWYDPDAL